MIHKFGERVLARICGRVLDCEVTRGSYKDRPTLVAEAALRGREGPIAAGQFQLRLLDSGLRPVPALEGLPDRLPLPQAVWAGTCSTFCVQHHELCEARLMFLEVTVFDDRAIVGAFGESDDEEEGGEDEPNGDDDDGDNGGDDDSGNVDDDGDQVDCCVDEFRHPTGNLDTIVKPLVFKETPESGPYMYDVSSEGFSIHARFSNRKGCLCVCCEYRQEIKGKMDFTLLGKLVKGGPITDYALVGLSPASQRLVPIRGLNPDNFIEDTIGDPNAPGNPWAAGHRDRPNGVIDLDTGDVQGIPDSYPDACHYLLRDTPHMRHIFKDDSVDIDMTFRGKIIDVCNDKPSSEPAAEWTWKFRRQF